MDVNVSQLISPKEAWIRACTKSYFETRSKQGNYKNLIRVTHPNLDSIRIQSKIRDLVVNNNGTKLYVITREALLVIALINNTQHSQSNVHSVMDNVTLATKSTMPIKASKILVDPENPDVFILLCQDINSDIPLIRAYEYKTKIRLLGEWSVKEADIWYTGVWNPNGNILFFVDRKNRIYMMKLSYNIENSPIPVYIKTINSEIYGITISSDGNSLLVYGSEGCIEIFPFSESITKQPLEPINVVGAHSHIVTCCATNKCNNLIATGGSDHTIHVFESSYKDSFIDNLICIGTFPELEGQISNISFSKCGLLVAWGTKDSTQFDDADERDDEASTDFSLTIAGVRPCQIYYRQPTNSPVTHCVFIPSSYIVIFALDYDYMKKGPLKGQHCPIGVLYLE